MTTLSALREPPLFASVTQPIPDVLRFNRAAVNACIVAARPCCYVLRLPRAGSRTEDAPVCVLPPANDECELSTALPAVSHFGTMPLSVLTGYSRHSFRNRIGMIPPYVARTTRWDKIAERVVSGIVVNVVNHNRTVAGAVTGHPVERNATPMTRVGPGSNGVIQNDTMRGNLDAYRQRMIGLSHLRITRGRSARALPQYPAFPRAIHNGGLDGRGEAAKLDATHRTGKLEGHWSLLTAGAMPRAGATAPRFLHAFPHSQANSTTQNIVQGQAEPLTPEERATLDALRRERDTLLRQVRPR